MHHKSAKYSIASKTSATANTGLIDTTHSVINNLIYAQLSFFFFLAITIAVTRAGFSSNHGLSFYGEHLKTVVPFAAGFIFCDLFLLRAATLLPKDPWLDNLAWFIRMLAVLLILIILTPDSLNAFFNVCHIIASTALFLFELAFALWLTIRRYHDTVTWSLLTAQFLAGVLAMLSQFHIVQYLSEGSLLFQLLFGFLLTYLLTNILRTSTIKESVEIF